MSWGVMAEPMGWGVVEEGWRKGPWTAEEDNLLIEYVNSQGEGRWNSVARLTGLKRNGKSCRLRWVNYLRPDLKRGQITPHEETIILELHARWGNRWSTIARSLPGRTDNEIKNYWRTHFKKKAKVTSVKPKARLLRKQQFQQQQLQQHHEEVEMDQMDMKKIMSLLENDNMEQVIPQGRPEVATAYPNPAEEQGLWYSMLSGFAPVLPQASSNEENFSWDGVWNMDDHIYGNLGIAFPTKKGVVQSAATTFYSY